MKKANDIVFYAKTVRTDAHALMDDDTIDFLGCSQPYVEEKIDLAIFALKDLKSYLKSVDKRQKGV